MENRLKQFPIFIVGCPRSGTTLLGLMLDSHPDISVAHEAAIFHLLYHHPVRQRWNLSSTIGRKSFLRRLKRDSNVNESLGEEVVRVAARTLESEKSLPPKLIIDSLFAAYLQNAGKAIWGEKTPTHYYYVGEIFSIYPKAAIICLIRDPRAVFASMKRYAQKKKGTNEYFWWMTESPWEASMLWMDCYENTMRWKNRVHFVKYEELVHSPEAVLRDLAEGYLNIAYDPKMLEYNEKAGEKIAGMPDWHKPTTQKVNPANADRWRSELTGKEVAGVESILHKQMEEFGYELHNDAFGNMANLRIAAKRGIYVGKRKINQNIRFTGWRICHSLRLVP